MEHQRHRDFLLQTAELLHRYGTPSHRLERVMTRVAQSLQIDASFLYTPTALFVSFRDGESESTHLRRVDAGDVELGKLMEFDEVLERLEDGKLSVQQAQVELQLVAQRPSRYSMSLIALSAGIASGASAVFFGGGLAEFTVAFVLGCLTCVLGWIVGHLPGEARLFEPLAAFSCAMLSIFIAAWVWPLDDRLATLASLIVLVPGLTFTTAMTELASRHLSSGVARMAGAGTTFLTLTVGVALAWRLGQPFRPTPEVTAHALPSWSIWPALAIAPLAFSILFQARVREWPVISIVSWLGVLAARGGQDLLGAEFGPFFGALTVGLGSNCYARWFDRPAMIPLTPGTLILVPGSLGYLSLTSFLDQRTLEGIDLAFNMVLVAVALVGGFLAANAILPPKRSL